MSEGRSEFVREVISTYREEHGPDGEKEAIKYLMVDPSQGTADRLWLWLVLSLSALLVIALVGIIVLLAMGKTTDIVLTAFTAVLTGLLGLFVKSPVKS